MRSWNATIFAIALLGAFVAAFGQSPDENWRRCQSSDPDQSIAGCSTLIQSGQESDANLSKDFDMRGLAYMHKREFDRAIQDYDQALRLNSRSAAATYNRALTYRLKGDNGRSISGYDQALQLTPSDADSFFGRGLSYAYQGDYDRAVQDYDQALRINPGVTDVFRARSSAYLHKGEYLRAVADYARWRGIFGITILCLVLIALAFGVAEFRNGDRHSMQVMQRLMGWIFGAESAHYMEVFLRSIQNTSHRNSGVEFLIPPAFSLVVVYVSAVAWWTIWKRRSAAKGFAISASFMQILIFVGQFIPPVRLASDYHVLALWIGAVGLLAFLSRKQEWPPWSLTRQDQSHLTTLFQDERSCSTVTKAD
jgi:cytochrome c-type biogenesis protein CcmH/NrfG